MSTLEVAPRLEPLASRARWALASLALAMLMPSLDTSIANAGLPQLAQAFDASFQQVQWVVLAYLLTITILIASAGRLGDLLGRRRVLLGGIMLFCLGSLGCGLAPGLHGLLAARAVQGVGAAAMLAQPLALVSDSLPKGRTGSAMGLLGTLSAWGPPWGQRWAAGCWPASVGAGCSWSICPWAWLPWCWPGAACRRIAVRSQAMGSMCPGRCSWPWGWWLMPWP
ncbi:hypothetical protein P308_11680 [Pseudomonas piscis]|nr:hypothetical protein P308_12115 [Pseudomonas piscis]ERO60955.1 hypothetical protein P308_11680 [Pseudomonas piscis]